MQKLSSATTREPDGAPEPDDALEVAYARPAAEIAEFISGYQIYYAGEQDSAPRTNHLLPGLANVRVSVCAGPVEVTLGRRRFAVLPPVALTGPTTYAPNATTHGGVLVGFGVTPLGWSRLFRRSAGELCDRIVPLAELVGPALPDAMLDELSALPDPAPDAVAAVLDRLLMPLFHEPGPDEAAVRALTDALADPAMTAVADIVARTGLAAPVLRRIATRYFGATPKILLRRARFLRAFLGFFRTGEEPGYPGIEDQYHDVSHFLRDADRFLGMTPRRFAALTTVSLDRSLQARAAALGGPTCVLHEPEPPDSEPSPPSPR